MAYEYSKYSNAQRASAQRASDVVQEIRKQMSAVRQEVRNFSHNFPAWANHVNIADGLLTCGISALYSVVKDMEKAGSDNAAAGPRLDGGREAGTIQKTATSAQVATEVSPQGETAMGTNELKPLPPQREGQYMTMTICRSGSADVNPAECGHWESPARVQQRIDAAAAEERERLALLAKSREDNAGFHTLIASEIRAGCGYDP